MNEKPISTRPPSESESLLKKKFAESVAAQSDQMDALGRQLISLELAIPGLYATVLKLVAGGDATLKVTPALYVSFACWGLALLLTLIGMIPRNWTVNRDILKQDAFSESDILGIEDFFYKSAQYKRNFLIAACLCFFAGIVSAALSVI